MTRILLLFTVFVCQYINAQTTNYKISINESIAGNSYKRERFNLNNLNVYDLEYKSFDDTKVNGYIIEPKGENKKYPVIIYNRGGNGSFGMVTDTKLVRLLCQIANKGYIVIGSQLRGSEGSEGEDEWGGKDIDDVMALFSIIDNMEKADTSKIAQVGWSRGGVTNFHMLKRTDRIKTTVNIAGPSDLLTTKRAIMFKVYKNRIKNYEKDSIKYTNRVSPIYQVDSIKNKKSSILYLHGDKDIQVTLQNSMDLYSATKNINIKSEIIIYPDGEHNLWEQLDMVIDDIDKWVKKELEN